MRRVDAEYIRRTVKMHWCRMKSLYRHRKKIIKYMILYPCGLKLIKIPRKLIWLRGMKLEKSSSERARKKGERYLKLWDRMGSWKWEAEQVVAAGWEIFAVY